jgi:hypothetical protein
MFVKVLKVLVKNARALRFSEADNHAALKPASIPKSTIGASLKARAYSQAEHP